MDLVRVDDMTKSLLLLGSTAISVIVGGGAFAASLPGTVIAAAPPPAPDPKAKILYSQNSNDAGNAIDSQNFSSGLSSTYNDQAADDFVVPRGEKWRIGEVDVTGAYFNGSGPANSLNIYFYTDDKQELPGKAIKEFPQLKCRDNSGSFACALPHKLSLKPGHYWLSVQANCKYPECGEWGWEMTDEIHNDEAAWRSLCDNGCIGSCLTWETLDTCFGYEDDLMFVLKS
jgi:hypothetical protein